VFLSSIHFRISPAVVHENGCCFFSLVDYFMSFLMIGVACWMDQQFGINFGLKVQWSWEGFLVMLSRFFPNWGECFGWEWDQFTSCENRLTQDSTASKIMKIRLDFIIEWLFRKSLKLNKCNERTCGVTYWLKNSIVSHILCWLVFFFSQIKYWNNVMSFNCGMISIER